MNAFESHHDNKSLCCCCLMFWRWKEGVREELNAADILFLAVLVSCKPTVDCSMQLHRKSFFQIENGTHGQRARWLVRVPKLYQKLNGGLRVCFEVHEIKYRIYTPVHKYMLEVEEEGGNSQTRMRFRILISWKSNGVSIIFVSNRPIPVCCVVSVFT